MGCGDGAWLRSLAARRTDLVLAGVDRTRRPGLPGCVDFVPLDLETDPLPYPDRAFQLVVCAHVLEHLAHPGPALREMRRVLSPGGRLYVEVPSERTARAPSMPAWFGSGPSPAFADDPTHVGRPWSPDELADLLAERGLVVLRRGRARSPALWPASPLLLVGGVALRRARPVHRALEQIAGLASYAVARRA